MDHKKLLAKFCHEMNKLIIEGQPMDAERFFDNNIPQAVFTSINRGNFTETYNRDFPTIIKSLLRSNLKEKGLKIRLMLDQQELEFFNQLFLLGKNEVDYEKIFEDAMRLKTNLDEKEKYYEEFDQLLLKIQKSSEVYEVYKRAGIVLKDSGEKYKSIIVDRSNMAFPALKLEIKGSELEDYIVITMQKNPDTYIKNAVISVFDRSNAEEIYDILSKTVHKNLVGDTKVHFDPESRITMLKPYSINISNIDRFGAFITELGKVELNQKPLISTNDIEELRSRMYKVFNDVIDNSRDFLGR
jgi:hypothetical protein